MSYIGRTGVMAGTLAVALTLSNITAADDMKGPPGLILWTGGHTNSGVFCRKRGTTALTFNDYTSSTQNFYYVVYQEDQGGALRVQKALPNLGLSSPGHLIALDEECSITSAATVPGVQIMKPVYTFYTTTDTWSTGGPSGGQYLLVTISNYLVRSKLFQVMKPIKSGSQTQILYIFQTADDASSAAYIVQPNVPTAIPDAFKHTDCSVPQC